MRLEKFGLLAALAAGMIAVAVDASTANAQTLRDNGFLGLQLANATLIALGVSAVVLDLDSGLDRCAASTRSPENKTAIGLPNALGLAGAKVGQCEFHFQRRGRIDTARHFPVDR